MRNELRQGRPKRALVLLGDPSDHGADADADAETLKLLSRALQRSGRQEEATRVRRSYRQARGGPKGSREGDATAPRREPAPDPTDAGD